MVNGYKPEQRVPVVVDYQDYLVVCMKLAQARNDTIEEMAQRLEKELTLPFGKDTVQSFAGYLRRMKV